MGRITVDGVGKAYKRYPGKWARLAEWATGQVRHQKTWVLRDVSFRVEPGEAVGIVGMNGAGKSTLLKIVTGTTEPTAGSVALEGRVAALLELGMGFHPDFTGRQNALIAGQLLGYRVEEVAAEMDAIEAFADIGEYFDRPVRIFSSGMQVRLAFAAATAIRPDILIVDEALAVGDVFFQQKCFERLVAFREQGTTLLLVSHSPGMIIEMCDRAILLRKGELAFDGSSKEATDMYQADVLIRLDKRPQEIEVTASEPEGGRSAGSVRSASATLVSVRTFEEGGNETQTLWGDATAEIRLHYRIERDLHDPHVGFKIRNRFGAVLFETNSYCMGKSLGARMAGDELVVSFRFPMLLAPGDYTVTAGLANGGFAEGSFEEVLSFEHETHAFTVVRGSGSILWSGVVNLCPTLSVVGRGDA